MTERRDVRRVPSSEYSRMFSAFAFGGFLFVTGAIGLDVSRLRGLFDGMRWVDTPIWWQMALGLLLILLGVYWFRLIAGPRD